MAGVAAGTITGGMVVGEVTAKKVDEKGSSIGVCVSPPFLLVHS